MRHASPAARLAAAALAALAAAGCADPAAPAAATPSLRKAAAENPAQAALLQAVKAATARYHSVAQAERAGYVPVSPCIAAPGLGGMGFHYELRSAVDPVFDPMVPEALVYAPKQNGKLELVAVEYLVIDVRQPRPSFAGHPFDVGGTPIPVPHYTLHAWVHETNPAGTFAPFNPTVSCATTSPAAGHTH